MSASFASNIFDSIQIPKNLKTGNRFDIPKLHGSSDALWISELAREQKKCIAIFCADPLEAHRLLNEIKLFNGELNVQLFPDWETLPYDTFSPHQDLISERLKTLNLLHHSKVDVVLIPATTAVYKLSPPSFLGAYSFLFKRGDRINEQALISQLTDANYQHVNQVTASGEYSVRGGIIDIYPMGSQIPYRLDLFDDEIETIRTFDVDTQRSALSVDKVQLLPGREYPFDEQARNTFRNKFREKFEGDPTKAIPYRDVGNGINFAGIEYYIPLFFDETATIFDYLPTDAITLTIGDINKQISEFHADTQKRYKFLYSDRERPVLAPHELFLTAEEFFKKLNKFQRLHLSDIASPEIAIKEPPKISVRKRSPEPFADLINLLSVNNTKVLLCVDSAGRREILSQRLYESGLSVDVVLQNLDIASFISGTANFAMVVAPINKGFTLSDIDVHILSENDLFPDTAALPHIKRKREKHTDVDAMVRDLSEIQVGDPIVHAQHGIGRYQGLVHLEVNGETVEMLQINYEGDTKLYVPVSHLHVISRYSGSDPESAPLHRLGSGQWEKACKKAAKQVRDTAAELLNLYALRAMREGYKFKIPLEDYHQFSEGFDFEETPDQQQAIDSVLEDMASDKPMDRLVCGDVGFGKTEVALRAAFIAVANNKQVVILCPTTLLAEQHAQTFIDRFADWPINVALLSRFRTGKELNETINGCSDGNVDIVIGTHKVLSNKVKFKSLGLIIIDEEHRFGVRQKEALKALRAEVDILTLTATPIPRTLSMSLEGIRDLSIIATAPQKRLAIKTFVRREDKSTIREAVLRELKRGGQLYFLHNEVDTIHNRKAMLEELLPEARIGVAHGQMSERELEAVMKDFYHQRINLLLCTTIIETGIDVPTANTIIINRADKLGLAQLHQLRGRVGRSHHQAYAYLLTLGDEAITRQAKMRLEAIQAMEELGAGFYLAMHDLEIRGTGEVLGEQQSGNIHEVGFTLYADMINKTMDALKNGKEPDLESPFDLGTEINLHTSARLPEEYCPDVHSRLTIYKRLALQKTEGDVIDMQAELVDRFGPIPLAAKLLIHSHRLRILAEKLAIKKVDVSEDIATLHFDISQEIIDPAIIIELIQKNRKIKLQGPTKLRIEFEDNFEIERRIQIVRDLILHLTPQEVV
ncbi:transcription-repair coupling factor [Taylorella equigenitalis]|uniref:transcription-repair coupling factor n=1 Tax=Taylorella equigenitalis TaxID=29575 RepID=UPI00240D86BC|nr:transcription-repair coupling factor [Taylorella equigenitalis]WFD80320.1 transcription-repair coupling factor [Taylorella equigenitalis]